MVSSYMVAILNFSVILLTLDTNLVFETKMFKNTKICREINSKPNLAQSALYLQTKPIVFFLRIRLTRTTKQTDGNFF
jgi:hypothetical protein